MKLKHPNLRDVEIEVSADRVDAHLRSGWVKKHGKRERREPEQTNEDVVVDEVTDEKESQDG